MFPRAGLRGLPITLVCHGCGWLVEVQRGEKWPICGMCRKKLYPRWAEKEWQDQPEIPQPEAEQHSLF